MQDYIEQLIGEWYEFQGYFVRRDLWVGLQDDGSYECELDVVAYHPTHNSIVHIETLTDVLSWSDREQHLRTKFDAAKKYLHHYFVAEPNPALHQITLVVFEGAKNPASVLGSRVMTMPQLLSEIFTRLKTISMESFMIPASMPLLRTLQVVAEYRDVTCEALLEKTSKRTKTKTTVSEA